MLFICLIEYYHWDDRFLPWNIPHLVAGEHVELQ